MMKRFVHTVKHVFCGERGKRGESLAEVLAAILVGTFALLMLAMAITVSTRITTDSREFMDDYYAANSAAITSGSSTLHGTAALTGVGEASSLALVDNSKSDMNVAYHENSEAGSSSIVLYDAAGGGS